MKFYSAIAFGKKYSVTITDSKNASQKLNIANYTGDKNRTRYNSL